MRTGWDNAQSAADEAKERAKKGGKFLTLDDDGEKVVVAFLGEPGVREIVWENNKLSNFTKEHAARGVEPQVKFSFNVYNKEAQKVQIFEQGSLWFNEVLACKKKYGLDKTWFEITRNGAKGDQKTRYKVLFDDRMSDAEVEQMRAIEKKGDLFDLSKEIDSSSSDRQESKAPSNNKASDKTDGPISDKAKEMLIARLTELPGKATKTFLAEFSIEKVKELPQSAFDAAMSFLEKLEAEAKGGKEVDPFD